MSILGMVSIGYADDSCASVNKDTSVCKKFGFNHIQSDSQRCGGKDKRFFWKRADIEVKNCTTFYDLSKLPNQKPYNLKFDEDASQMALLITSVFENGDTSMGYGYVEKLHDCRGYTAGYCGFTTGTNDALAVVQEYTNLKKSNGLAKFLPELQRISKLDFADPKRDDTGKLDGYPQAWESAACGDPSFIRAQLDVGSAMYLQPAIKYAASVNVTSNLGKAIFYDTIIQHGWQYTEPLINLPRVMLLTSELKSHFADERAYLQAFLTVRNQLACCYPGKVWKDSAGRSLDLMDLLSNEKSWNANKDLKSDITLGRYGKTVKQSDKSHLYQDTSTCHKTSIKSLPAGKKLPIPNKTCSK